MEFRACSDPEEHSRALELHWSTPTSSLYPMEPGQAEEGGQHGQPALIQDTSNESGQNSSCIHARAFLKTLGQNE